MKKEIMTSKRQTVVIETDNPKIIDHFNDSDVGIENHAESILHQINNDRIYDFLLDGKRNQVIIDLGANIGLFSLYVHDCAQAVYSVEPTPRHFEILAELTRNYPNIHPINAALHKENSEIDFYISDINSTMNSSFNKFGNQVKVQGKTIAQIMQDYNIEHADLVKCDIEGSEMSSLTDVTVGEVFEKIDKWLIETHRTDEDSLENNREYIKQIFEYAGYTVEYFHHDGLYAFK